MRFGRPEYPQYEHHKWVDWLELKCLANRDGELSLSDAMDLISESETQDEYDERDEATNPIPEESNPIALASDPGSERAENNDRASIRVAALFEFFRHRQYTFGSDYPFIYDKDKTLLRRVKELGDRHALYIYLLMCSQLRFFRSEQSKLTSDFETISLVVFKRQLPDHAVSHIFGSSAATNPIFSGNLWTKIRKLAILINEEVTAKERDFAPTDTGDRGLDLVGWTDPGDQSKGRVLFFGQCACTDEWTTKQFSSSGSAWRGKLSLRTDPINMVFTPLCPRHADGEWFQDDQIACIPMDRLRITKNLPVDHDCIRQLDSYAHIEELINYREEEF